MDSTDEYAVNAKMCVCMLEHKSDGSSNGAENPASAALAEAIRFYYAIGMSFVDCLIIGDFAIVDADCYLDLQCTFSLSFAIMIPVYIADD